MPFVIDYVHYLPTYDLVLSNRLRTSRWRVPGRRVTKRLVPSCRSAKPSSHLSPRYLSPSPSFENVKTLENVRSEVSSSKCFGHKFCLFFARPSLLLSLSLSLSDSLTYYFHPKNRFSLSLSLRLLFTLISHFLLIINLVKMCTVTQIFEVDS